VPDIWTKLASNRTRVTVVPVGGHPGRSDAGHRLGRPKELLCRGHIAGLAQHHVHQRAGVPSAIASKLGTASQALLDIRDRINLSISSVDLAAPRICIQAVQKAFATSPSAEGGPSRRLRPRSMM
jgi:hypothetical protein